MKTVCHSNYVHEKKSSFTVKAKQASEILSWGTTARAAAAILGAHPITAIRFYRRLRFLIASQLPSYELNGKVEADESDFGGTRKGGLGKVAVRVTCAGVATSVTRLPYNRSCPVQFFA